mgnify:FL=1
MSEFDYNYIASEVRKAQNGDRDAFAELYAATYQKVYSFAYRYVKDEYLAQDIMQEVFILVLRNINNLKKPKLFISWVNQITFHVCLDTAKKHTLHISELEEDMSVLGDTLSAGDKSNPQTLLEETVGEQEVKDLILSLPPKEAKALSLVYLANLSQQDAADTMGCSLSSLKRYLVKGKAHLEKLLAKREGGAVNV